MAGTISRRAANMERLGYGTLVTGADIERGDLLMYNTNGYLAVLDDTASCVFAGIATQNGVAGDVIDIDPGSKFFYPNAAAALTDNGQPVYGAAAGTISLATGAHAVLVGRIVAVEVGVGWWVETILPGPVTVSSAMSQDGTDVRPAIAGSAIQTDDPAAEAAVLNLDNNIVSAEGTDANIDVIITPKGTGAISVPAGTYESNVTADDDIPNLKRVVDNFAPMVAWDLYTTDGAGEIAIASMTATGVVLATCAEDPGAALVLSDVVCGVGKVTVYTKNTGTDARAALATKKVAMLVLALS